MATEQAPPLSPRALLRDPALLWATGLGVGFLKPAPGTWGSAAAVVVWWFFLAPLAVWIQLLVCVAYFLTAWLVCAKVGERYGVHDAGEVVADEVVGMWLALAFAPQSLIAAAFAFALFRLLDIVKPGPIGWLDRSVGGGLGVLLDDVVAGALTGLTIALLAPWVPVY